LSDAMPDDRPWLRVSIITPSCQQGQFIEETIPSILLQPYPDLEYFVIDGGSTDDSVGIIRKYAPWISDWVSEPGCAKSRAINKGFSQATGVLVNWLKSDD
jgi:glycosyltransferase involved in cell wall biosynthesis